MERKYRVLSELAGFESTFPKLLISGRCSLRKNEVVDFYKKKGFISDFIYPAVGEGGRFFPLFKVLYTNKCTMNCYYCANRSGRNTERYEFKPDELTRLFMEYYNKGWVRGLFLSSSIYPTPNIAQEKLLETIKLSRQKYNYEGYIHCKILPGADEDFIDVIAKYSDRMSINLEAVGEVYMKKLAPQKSYKDNLISLLRKLSSYSERLKCGIVTQFIVGAVNETDKDLLFYVEHLYDRYKLRRVYYSGFVPVVDTPLESYPICSHIREYRLYQADFLMRRYNFSARDFVYGKDGNLIPEKDPKMMWAINNPSFFPIEINTASFQHLIRVPGIGIKTAMKIIETRKTTSIKEEVHLKKLGVILDRALDFILVSGKKIKKEAKQTISQRQMFLWEDL